MTIVYKCVPKEHSIWEPGGRGQVGNRARARPRRSNAHHGGASSGESDGASW